MVFHPHSVWHEKIHSYSVEHDNISPHTVQQGNILLSYCAPWQNFTPMAYTMTAFHSHGAPHDKLLLQRTSMTTFHSYSVQTIPVARCVASQACTRMVYSILFLFGNGLHLDLNWNTI